MIFSPCWIPESGFNVLFMFLLRDHQRERAEKELFDGHFSMIVLRKDRSSRRALRKSDFLIGHRSCPPWMELSHLGLLRDQGVLLKGDYWTMVEFFRNRLREIYDLNLL